MKNITKIINFLTKFGPKGILIHTIPKTPYWLICQKIEKNKWEIILCNPMGTILYNLKSITDKEHIKIWKELIKIEIETKISQEQIAQQYREKIYQIMKKNINRKYYNIIKNNKQKKQNGKIL